MKFKNFLTEAPDSKEIAIKARDKARSLGFRGAVIKYFDEGPNFHKYNLCLGSYYFEEPGYPELERYLSSIGFYHNPELSLCADVAGRGLMRL